MTLGLGQALLGHWMPGVGIMRAATDDAETDEALASDADFSLARCSLSIIRRTALGRRTTLALEPAPPVSFLGSFAREAMVMLDGNGDGDTDGFGKLVLFGYLLNEEIRIVPGR
jgi:hypothetical protein